jgi:hypothetical protein
MRRRGRRRRKFREYPAHNEGQHQFQAFNPDAEAAAIVQSKIAKASTQEKYEGGVKAGKEKDWNVSKDNIGDHGKEVRL